MLEGSNSTINTGEVVPPAAKEKLAPLERATTPLDVKIENKATNHDEVFQSAIRKGNFAEAASALESGANPNLLFFTTQYTVNEPYTLIYYLTVCNPSGDSCSHLYVDKIKWIALLLHYGADPLRAIKFTKDPKLLSLLQATPSYKFWLVYEYLFNNMFYTTCEGLVRWYPDSWVNDQFLRICDLVMLLQKLGKVANSAQMQTVLGQHISSNPLSESTNYRQLRDGLKQCTHLEFSFHQFFLGIKNLYGFREQVSSSCNYRSNMDYYTELSSFLLLPNSIRPSLQFEHRDDCTKQVAKCRSLPQLTFLKEFPKFSQPLSQIQVASESRGVASQSIVMAATSHGGSVTPKNSVPSAPLAVSVGVASVMCSRSSAVNTSEQRVDGTTGNPQTAGRSTPWVSFQIDDSLVQSKSQPQRALFS